MVQKKIIVIFAVIVLSTLFITPRSFAQDTFYEQHTWHDKLLRGVVNMVTAPVEIVRNVHLHTLDEHIGIGLTVGLGKGIMRTLFRLGTGAIDTVTFPFDWPDMFKDPLMEPAYVWQEWNEFYI